MLPEVLASAFPPALSPPKTVEEPDERFGVGAAKTCAPPTAYAENALGVRPGVP